MQVKHVTDNGLAKYRVFRALATCTQGDDNIVTYYTKLNSIWEEIKDNTTGTPCYAVTAPKTPTTKELCFF